MIDLVPADLRELYADASKHSQYQSLPTFVSNALGYQESIDQNWRGDHTRLAFIQSLRPVASGERWADFGANTGYFTLSLADAHAEASFTAIEANLNHATLIQRIAQAFGMPNVSVLAAAIGLDELATLPTVDVMLHLNVLHHAGHDFDSAHVINESAFPGYAEKYLGNLRKHAGELIFQMGSNWGGDKSKPLVPVHADAEKLIYMAAPLLAAGWRIAAVAYPRREGEAIVYRALSGETIALVNTATQDVAKVRDSLGDLGLETFPGEFYRRPLFHCIQD